MKLPAAFAIPCLCALALISCATDEEKTIPIDKTGEVTPPKLVGRIASVPSDKRFVLIQSYGKWESSAGAILISRGAEDRSANLLVTGEALGQYAAADVQAGTLAVGDAVYSRETQKIKTPAPPEEPVDSKITRPF